MPRFTKLIASIVLVSSATFLGCANNSATRAPMSATTTKAEQQAMTPDQAVARLAAGNKRFVAGQSENRDYVAQARTTASGQYPFAVVLSCIDSRAAPEIVFDQGIGDVFVPRIAGNYVQADILGSMEFATKVAGAKVIVVVGHSECGAVKGACDDVQLGNLTTVIQAIRPAVKSVQNVSGERNSSNHEFVREVTVKNVQLTVEKIRTDSPILRELEQSGQIKIVGAMYDLATREVVWLN
ncbi:MAG: carbonic anhydrase family protein [Phycisphaerae bacterium]|nr:carbonic anhydrase family protein [Phycisphaerae bacterium]